MEILFKNSYTRTKKVAKEFYRFHYFQRKSLLACYILVAIPFLADIVSAVLGQYYSIEVLIFVPLFGAMLFYSYCRQVNMMIKRDNEVHGKEIDVETIVTDSYIQGTASTGAVNRIEYKKIKNAVQTKNLILLRSKANLIFIFDKNTFEIGSKEEFVSFLRARGIKVKGK